MRGIAKSNHKHCWMVLFVPLKEVQFHYLWVVSWAWCLPTKLFIIVVFEAVVQKKKKMKSLQCCIQRTGSAIYTHNSVIRGALFLAFLGYLCWIMLFWYLCHSKVSNFFISSVLSVEGVYISAMHALNSIIFGALFFSPFRLFILDCVLATPGHTFFATGNKSGT